MPKLSIKALTNKGSAPICPGFCDTKIATAAAKTNAAKLTATCRRLIVIAISPFC
jgi:hypothetical protein